MTLPFDKTNQKRYQCFVCGHNFYNYEEYKQHITSSHELGREYVLCPLERCKAAVRDVRSHFKVKHPHENMPKIGQMKATIWKDPNKHGKMNDRKPNFREGYFISKKNGGKEMHYRSGYECEVYACLEKIPEVIKYDVEPFPIKYLYNGKQHEYNPDLSIIYDDDRVEIWEIKPANQTALPLNEAKWAACQCYCESRGWSFIVVTEVGIGKLKKRTSEINPL
jgi:hypothetical protein